MKFQKISLRSPDTTSSPITKMITTIHINAFSMSHLTEQFHGARKGKRLGGA